jgi:hypothetical protein
MAVAALIFFPDRVAGILRPPLVELPLTPGLLAMLRRYHLYQFGLRAILATVMYWIASGGGGSEHALERLHLVGENPDPHVLCFVPAINQRFFSCLIRAHAVVPYRVEEGRVYVYDPNYPKDRERFVEFWRDDVGRCVGFEYEGFSSREGWGMTLGTVPASANRF